MTEKQETTVLLVDDNAMLLEMVTVFLERKGYRVRCAKDPAEAIKALGEGPAPDLVILDYMMPLASGAAVYEHLRRTPGTQLMPIIVLSAISSSIVERTIPQSPYTQALSKPVDFDLLEATLRKLLGPKVPRT